jgi:hypothetical protein
LTVTARMTKGAFPFGVGGARAQAGALGRFAAPRKLLRWLVQEARLKVLAVAVRRHGT